MLDRCDDILLKYVNIYDNIILYILKQLLQIIYIQYIWIIQNNIDNILYPYNLYTSIYI